MVWTDTFLIAHIPKTGGDAIKQIVTSLDLPIEMRAVTDRTKHEAVDPGGRDLILSIRRLPSRELSWLRHNQIHYGKHCDEGAEFLISQTNGETEICKHLAFGVNPKAYIRSERLRQDLRNTLGRYFALSEVQIDVIRTAKTKRPMTYDRDASKLFTESQIRALYERSPLWCECEIRAYGGLTQ